MMFARESYSDRLVEEMLPLWKDHHAETAPHYHMALEPNLMAYEQMASSGALRIFTVRNGANSLHGYQVMLVSPHPHSIRSLQAVQDILYICPQFRKGLTGYRFIKWCGDQLRAEGVQIVHQHISARYDFGHLLNRLGYELEDKVYSKNLREVH